MYHSEREGHVTRRSLTGRRQWAIRYQGEESGANCLAGWLRETKTGATPSKLYGGAVPGEIE